MAVTRLLVLPAIALACTSDLDCSLNGVCSGGACSCDAPWKGESCGVLGFAVTSASAKSLYTEDDTRNTWNGPIVELNGKYHFYNPLYVQGSLLESNTVLHGIADSIEGPYSWDSLPQIDGGSKSNPAFVVFPGEGNNATYSLWMSSGSTLVADSPFGPFTPVVGAFGGSNPAPLYHKGAFYVTTQQTKKIWTAPSLLGPWTVFADIDLSAQTGTGTPYGVLEDPFMWIDGRSHWHIINHAFDTTQIESCAASTVSAHLFSKDGKSWNILDPKVEPYGHTVQYDDGTSHTYNTLERPFIFFDKNGQMTHLALAADLVTGNEGCKDNPHCFIQSEQGKCSCTDCKYTDHAGSIVIRLDLPSKSYGVSMFV
eukprot:TRINITY_DN32432_c0_g1_i1.p1 TRINITY_DN32432_c0_g1~~TRINITY_DN32432_c0_g1_i1.p1  ORF type:complete len:369 (+),score=31.04 TRINITY_DN32432_c0_g1_i1:76-1182(+)